MSSRIVPRVARARPTESETRLAALASIEARRARIAAATAKLEVPASKNHRQFAARRQARSPAPPRPSEEEAGMNTTLFRKASYLKRPATPRFARQAAPPIAACRDVPNPDPLEQDDFLVAASEETLALHKTYGRSHKASNPAKWNQAKIPCSMINGERLSRKGRPQRRLQFREGDVTRTKIVSRWISDVAEEEEEEEEEEESEAEDVSLPKEMSLPKFEDWEDESYDWAQAIKNSLEKKIF